jgi:predicted TIM-barrel fold metal-dependent hydrolase
MRLYIDCGVRLGRAAKREALVPYMPEELIREMEHCCVHAAMIENMASTGHSFVRGNAELFEIHSANPRLYPLITCPPTYQWETPEGAGYLSVQLDKGAKGVLMRPGPLRHDLNPVTLEPTVYELIKRDLPLVLTIEDTTFPALRDVLAAFPELKVLFLYSNWAFQRQLFPLLDRYPNLTVDLGGNQANDLVDVIAKNFGVRRMVYSSGYPQRCVSGIKPLIEYSDLGEADKDLVAHGNACRLLGIDKALLQAYDVCHMDDMEKTLTAGKPMSAWPIIDIHAHVVDVKDSTTCVMMFNADFDNIAKKIERLGVQKVAFTAWEGCYGAGARANDTVRQGIERYPDKFIGYATANPNYEGDIDNAIENHERHGFLGIKPYSQMQGRKFNDPVYKPWFEYGNSRRLFALIHSGDQATADQIDEIAPMYPDLTFLMAHSGLSWDGARINSALAKKHDNVMLELTYTTMTRGVVEFFVRENGSERVFYGTDLPMRDPGPQLAWVVFAEISFEDKLNITCRNAERLLKRVLPPHNS